MQLYLFEHCSLCFRVRMTAALKDIPLDEVVVVDDDSKTMVDLVGRRVIPILVKDDGEPMLESMDMVDLIEGMGEPIYVGPERSEMAELAQRLVSKTPLLTMPRYPQLGLPEFATPEGHNHYVARKEKALGSFASHLERTEDYIAEVEPVLADLDAKIQSKEAVNGTLSKDDVRILPLLRSAAIIADLAFPANVQSYFTTMMDRTGYAPLPTA